MATMFLRALANLFRSPATVKYPFEKTYKPDDFRGLIKHDSSLCIWCRKCEMVCPPGAIVFDQAMDGKQTYHYNRHVCIYCGECVRACPKAGAIVQTAEAGSPATFKEDPNNSWGKIVKEAMANRALYAEAKKKAALEAAAAKAAAAKTEAAKSETPAP